MNKFFLIVLFFLIANNSSFSQKGMFKSAVKLFSKGYYQKALEKFYIVYSYDSSSHNLNYYIGSCYFYLNNFNKAISYLKYSIENVSNQYRKFDYNEKSAPPEAFLILGKAYHLTYRFDKSVDMFRRYLDLIDSTNKMFNEAKLWLNYSINGLNYINDTSELVIENIGKSVNTECNEYAPLVDFNEELLFFSSDRKLTGSSKKAIKNSDIFLSRFYNKKWNKPESINVLNSEYDDVPLCIANDKTELYIFRNENNNGNIFVSYNLDSLWTMPYRLNEFINSKFNEYSATISQDKQLLIFSSDREGGLGGKDLYMSKRLPNGEWGIPVNLGRPINTEYDEDCPFLTSDGLTLYFSSNCPKSIGGYDLFVSHLINDSTWSEPENLGYPINTVENELFFSITYDEKKAYFSSVRPDTYGKNDIYLMDLLSLPEKSYVIIKGKVYIAGNNEPMKNIIINVYDENKKVLIGKFKPNKFTGNYVLILKKNHKYSIACETEECIFEPKILELKLNNEKEVEFPIMLDPLGKIKKIK